MNLDGLIRRFLYYPERLPIDAPLPPHALGAQEVFLDAADGNRIHALHWPAPQGRPTLLFLHGNAQTVFDWALVRQDLAPLDCGLLLPDYPGYGKSTGRPSEASLYAAGHAAMSWLAARGVPPSRTILFGKSLGGGVAGEIARDAPVLGVVLESTFRSIPSVARRLIPVIPVGGLFRGELYDTASKIASIPSPILIIHGTADGLIPIDEGRALYDLAREPKRLWQVPGAGHNDVAWRAGPAAYGRVLREWVDGLPPPSPPSP